MPFSFTPTSCWHCICILALYPYYLLLVVNVVNVVNVVVVVISRAVDCRKYIFVRGLTFVSGV